MRIDLWGPSAGEHLSQDLVAQTKEFTRILHQVDEISKRLEADAPALQDLRATIRTAISCAARQIVLDNELRSLALSDELTGLYNRRGFVALASQQMKVSRRSGRELLLCLADVDSLKAINDELGHQEGDLALIAAAEALRRTFRASDIVARIGGDEFAVLALEASGRDRARMLRRLEHNLEQVAPRHAGYKLSLSVGVARLDPRSCEPLSALMKEADQAMYQEKEKARASA